MDELNRRVAIEVMGEPEPPPAPGRYTPISDRTGALEIGDVRHEASISWPKLRIYGHEARWEPADFSGDMDLAIRAVDNVLERERDKGEDVLIELGYDLDAKWRVWICKGGACKDGLGDTAPEAICRALLAFVKRG